MCYQCCERQLRILLRCCEKQLSVLLLKREWELMRDWCGRVGMLETRIQLFIPFLMEQHFLFKVEIQN